MKNYKAISNMIEKATSSKQLYTLIQILNRCSSEKDWGTDDFEDVWLRVNNRYVNLLLQELEHKEREVINMTNENSKKEMFVEYNTIEQAQQITREYLEVVEMYDFLIDNGIASEEFMSGIICGMGFSEDTMKTALFYNTGYRDFNQYIEEEMSEE